MAPASSVLIVVPCCETAEGLDVAALERCIERTLNVRFLLIENGIAPDTRDALQRVATRAPEAVRLVHIEQKGRAEAVWRGIQVALSDGAGFVGYWDANLATALELIPEFMRALTPSDAFDIVLGVRIAASGQRLHRLRHHLGRVLASAASLALNLRVQDAQSGVAVFRVGPHTRAPFAEPFASPSVFDVEVVARYLSDGGARQRVRELALPCRTDAGAFRVGAVDFVRSLAALLDIFRRHDLGQGFRPLALAATGAFSRYVGVGGLGTGAHYAVLIASVEWLGLQPRIAAVLGAGTGAIINYFLNYTLTFACREAHQRALPKFALVALLGALASGYGVQTAGHWGVHYLWAQIGCTLFVLVAGFFLNRAWTFAARSRAVIPVESRGAEVQFRPER